MLTCVLRGPPARLCYWWCAPAARLRYWWCVPAARLCYWCCLPVPTPSLGWTCVCTSGPAFSIAGTPACSHAPCPTSCLPAFLPAQAGPPTHPPLCCGAATQRSPQTPSTAAAGRWLPAEPEPSAAQRRASQNPVNRQKASWKRWDSGSPSDRSAKEQNIGRGRAQSQSTCGAPPPHTPGRWGELLWERHCPPLPRGRSPPFQWPLQPGAWWWRRERPETPHLQGGRPRAGVPPWPPPAPSFQSTATPTT